MTRMFIPVEESFKEWRKDPAYVAAYDALEEEFALANEVLKARSRAKLSQAELAERMNTSQSAIARFEGGHVPPSTRTLKKLAEATGCRLRIVLEPIGKGKKAA